MNRFMCILALVCFVAALPAVAARDDKKIPEGVDPKLTSDDPEYGYNRNKPIKVGSKEQFGGPQAEKDYFNSLRDEQGKPVRFKRLASVGKGPDGNILDLYEVTTSKGKNYEMYIDMYHKDKQPDKQPAPKGFYKAKKTV